jgi:hypothetical protein
MMKSNLHMMLGTVLRDLSPSTEKPFIPAAAFTLLLAADDVSDFVRVSINLHERTIDEKRILELRKETDKVYLTFEWALIYCDGEFYRINGNHSSRMLLDRISDGTFMVGAPAQVSVYYLENEPDMRIVHNMYDTRNRTRSKRELYEIHSTYEKSLAAIPRDFHSHIMPAYYWAAQGSFKHDGTTNQHMAALGDTEYQEFCIWLRTMGILTWRSSYSRRGAIAAILATWRSDQDAAGDFWQLVQDEEGLTKYAPARKLADLLADGKREFQGSRIDKTGFDRKEYRRCVYCWNRWRKGDTEIKQMMMSANMKVL